MTCTRWIKELAISVLLAGGIMPAIAAEEPNAPSVRYQAVDDSVHHVRIDGSSNVTKWHVVGQRVIGGIDVPAMWQRKGGALHLEPDLEASQGGHDIHAWIPVLSIEGEKEGLSKKMYKHMEAYDHRYVTFDLQGVKSVSPSSQGDGARWQVQGDLTVSGVTRDVDLTLDITPLAGNRLQVEVQKALKMTDFDIDPPKALAGFVRAYDKVTVKIGWSLQRQSPQPTMPQADVSSSTREAVNGLLAAYGNVYQAVKGLKGDQIASAVGEAQNKLDQLEEADARGLEKPVTALGKGLSALKNTEKAKEVRTAFAQVSRALSSVLEKAGHGSKSSVIAYHYPDQEGLQAAEWLQVYDPAAEIATPYSNDAPNGIPDVAAIYPGERAQAQAGAD